MVDAVRIVSPATGPDEEWDAFVASVGGDTYSQSTAYASVKRASHVAHRVELRRDDRLIAGVQILARRTAVVGWIGYVAKGPVVADASPSEIEMLLDATLDFVRRQRVRVLVAQPVEENAVLDQALRVRGFGPSPAQVATTGTIAVALAPSEEALLKAMRSGLRRNIRKAERSGVTVRQGSRAELHLFHQMHIETASRNDFNPVSWARAETEWDTLAPLGYLKLFFAECEGRLLSGATVTAFGDRVIFRHAGWFRSTDSAALRPNDLLHWRIMQWAKGNGFAFYDFGGFDRRVAEGLLRGEDPPEEFRSTYSQFKLGYGGMPLVLPKSVWRVVPTPLRPLQPVMKWALESVPPARRALASRHNA